MESLSPFIRAKGKKRKPKIQLGAMTVEFALVAIILFSLYFAAWTLGIALLRYAILSDRVTTVLRRASVTPTLYADDHRQVQNCATFLSNIMGGTGEEAICQQSLAFALKGAATSIGNTSQIFASARIERTPNVNERLRCRLTIEARWQVPCFFCHWFRGVGIVPDGLAESFVKVRGSTFFEDPDFIFCGDEGCITCIGNPEITGFDIGGFHRC